MDLFSLVLLGIDLPRVLLIVFGLGMVIFVHELGHFWVARWCGVFVERFSIGFGPVILSWKGKETEYAISAIPLGGYVKMMGQTDTPEVEEKTDDVRSYQNKTVWQRMAIISAGVIMNVIFGFFCFILAFRLGVPENPAVVGSVIPGRPAWEKGLQPGDRIVAINDKDCNSFGKLLTGVSLSNPKSPSIKLKIERNGSTFEHTLQPIQDKLKPMIGVGPSDGLMLADPKHFEQDSPASKVAGQLADRDAIVAVAGEPVKSHQHMLRLLHRHRHENVGITIERTEKVKEPKRFDVDVAPTGVRDVGLEFDIGEITGVQQDSPAQQAVDAKTDKPMPILPKDRIKAVNGVSIDDINSLRLGDHIADLMDQSSEPIELTLLRQSQVGNETLAVKVTPRPLPPWSDYGHLVSLLKSKDINVSIPSLGIAYQTLPTVRKVRENSPAAKATPAIEVDDVVLAVDVIIEEKGKERTIACDLKEDQWLGIFWAMQSRSFVKSVKLKVERKGKPIEVQLTPTADPESNWHLGQRGFAHYPMIDTYQETTAAGAIQAGWERTRDSITQLYTLLHGVIFARTISPNNFAGPVSIFGIAYDVAHHIPKLIEFLGMLSINLAVINFLPIPILDGGHLMFLLYELFTGRLPSERWILVANFVGIGFILCLMLYVFGLDILRLM